jgi:hypothetical protein
MGWRQPLGSQSVHPHPGDAVLLASPPERAPPQIDYVMPVGPNRVSVGRHRVVREVARDHRTQPPTLVGQAVVASSSQLVLELPQGYTHAVASRMASKQEGSAPRAAADEREPQEVERLRLALPAVLPSLDRIAAELQQPGLFPMKFERELLEPLSHRVPEPARFGFVLEADDQIVSVAHDDHVACDFAPPPLLRPQVEDVVQVDVGQHWRDHRALWRPLVTGAPVPVFQDPGFEPLGLSVE